MNLKNKTVLITGSSIGIGRELAYKFASEKCKIIVTYYKDKENAYEVKTECLKLGAKEVFLMKLNIMDNQNIKKIVNEIIKKYGKISILINNAGVINWKPLSKQTDKDIETQLRTNLEGLIKLTRELSPYITQMIINMGSASSLKGDNKMITYSASKWGVKGFTQALANELKDIKIHNFVSGGVATRMKNFQGIPPEKIAEVIVNFAEEKYKLPSGSDINARDYL